MDTRLQRYGDFMNGVQRVTTKLEINSGSTHYNIYGGVVPSFIPMASALINRDNLRLRCIKIHIVVKSKTPLNEPNDK